MTIVLGVILKIPVGNAEIRLSRPHQIFFVLLGQLGRLRATFRMHKDYGMRVASNSNDSHKGNPKVTNLYSAWVLGEVPPRLPLLVTSKDERLGKTWQAILPCTHSFGFCNLKPRRRTCVQIFT